MKCERETDRETETEAERDRETERQRGRVLNDAVKYRIEWTGKYQNTDNSEVCNTIY